ncbi:MAG: chemotaxis protein CheX [Clostridiales bacterium]|nr:chemotaxis protein CheX [Clostridiales bacterium]
MKVEYINPFIEAAQAVFKTLLGIDAKLGKIFIKTSPLDVGNMVIIIGVVGQIRGQVCLELDSSTAEKIVSGMMGGMTVTNMDEIAKSAIAELGNMIMGNTCTIFSKNKISIDITPPTILSGEHISLSNKVATIGIPLIIPDYGYMNINVSAEEML